MEYITKGKTMREKKLLKKHKFIQKIVQDNKLRGYRLYSAGYFGLPSFRDYHWV